ncbi:GNAT family N-acetyltransferase [Phaeobacter sp. HF9A]|uniref:GNAT family N-acetyltransferase n=1 Tax=Phaeobacter sp. HF9A TaxID=2721561 RepID=UPI00143019B6|nr:GNAT family N-acetyltransferase [Phaeobacter sp. HF9A]NIZ13177.1 GNAT family N-acetyltransferase [Phaeobacter sp. HF9A]
MAIEATKDDTTTEVALTPLTARHLPGALKLSQDIRWPYRLQDWEFALAAGQGLALERHGRLIGTALWWCWGQSNANAGMIIVTESEQGRGHGARLFDALLEANRGRNVALCSTKEGLALYQRRGFVEVGTVFQHQADFDMALAAEGDGIRPATATDLAAIQDFDKHATGLDRAALLAALTASGRVTLIAQADGISGYSIARRFGRGTVIGPVAATTTEDAKRLILEQLAQLQGQFVRIDVPAEHGLSDWLHSLGLPRTDQVTAMVKGAQPTPDGAGRIYALASQSLG